MFHILKYFATKLDNCMKFRVLFPAVLIDFPNSKVCLIGEWSIVKDYKVYYKFLMRFNVSEEK